MGRTGAGSWDGAAHLDHALRIDVIKAGAECEVLEEVFVPHQLPFGQAVKSGDSYYLVWPAGDSESSTLTRMRDYLLEHLPDVTGQGIELLD